MAPRAACNRINITNSTHTGVYTTRLVTSFPKPDTQQTFLNLQVPRPANRFELQHFTSNFPVKYFVAERRLRIYANVRYIQWRIQGLEPEALAPGSLAIAYRQHIADYLGVPIGVQVADR